MLATDGLVLAAVCDATLLVLRVGQSDRRATEQAQERLLSVGGRIVGVVVNGFRRDGQYQYYSAPYEGQNEPREEAARS
jgi:Mrp family chromosome partitioning ATPase